MSEDGVIPWTKCGHCEGWLCWLHRMHVHDCQCPPVEDWEHSPYEPQPEEGA